MLQVNQLIDKSSNLLYSSNKVVTFIAILLDNIMRKLISACNIYVILMWDSLELGLYSTKNSVKVIM